MLALPPRAGVSRNLKRISRPRTGATFRRQQARPAWPGAGGGRREEGPAPERAGAAQWDRVAAAAAARCAPGAGPGGSCWPAREAETAVVASAVASPGGSRRRPLGPQARGLRTGASLGLASRSLSALPTVPPAACVVVAAAGAPRGGGVGVPGAAAGRWRWREREWRVRNLGALGRGVPRWLEAPGGRGAGVCVWGWT